MPENEQASVPGYAGKFRHTVDSKNRVTVPALWRRVEEEQFYAVADQNGEFINLYPPHVFQKMGERARNNDRLSPHQKRIYLRFFYANAHLVTVDKQGRILLPQELTDKVQLGGDVYLLGTDERIEVWPVDRLDQSLDDQLGTFIQVANILGD